MKSLLAAFLVIFTGCASVSRPATSPEQFNQLEKSLCPNSLDKNYFSDLKKSSVYFEKWKFGQEEEMVRVENYSFRCGKDMICKTENYVRDKDLLWLIRFMKYDSPIMLNGKLVYFAPISCVFVGYKLIGTSDSDASFLELIESEYNAKLVLD